ncbi:MAG: hypothetical protein LBP78_05685 [Acidaminococcales bacterium]|nr:hypothetical protein [Acidaminococcales bacterium]
MELLHLGRQKDVKAYFFMPYRIRSAAVGGRQCAADGAFFKNAFPVSMFCARCRACANSVALHGFGLLSAPIVVFAIFVPGFLKFQRLLY